VALPAILAHIPVLAAAGPDYQWAGLLQSMGLGRRPLAVDVSAGMSVGHVNLPGPTGSGRHIGKTLPVRLGLETTAAGSGLLVVIPVYNDWAAASLLLNELDKSLTTSGLAASLLVVDDGSTDPVPRTLRECSFDAIEQIHILSLRRNMGHQRAIAIALACAYEHLAPSAVVVMDGDGEDSPADVPKLVERLAANRDNLIVFAERRRRSESIWFRWCYALYRWCHLLLTGIPVRVGNFSIIPARQLEGLVVVSELWNHYAAAVFKARIPYDTVPTERARRLSGPSQMNFVGLVAHGLSALSVHAETMGVRLLVLTMVAGLGVGTLIGAVLAIRVLTSWAIPGWATTATGILAMLLVQAASLAVMFAFLVLHGRSQPSFVPLRDYSLFVRALETASATRRHEGVYASAGALGT
jgi:hypothetical protein